MQDKNYTAFHGKKAKGMNIFLNNYLGKKYKESILPSSN